MKYPEVVARESGEEFIKYSYSDPPSYIKVKGKGGVPYEGKIFQYYLCQNCGKIYCENCGWTKPHECKGHTPGLGEKEVT